MNLRDVLIRAYEDAEAQDKANRQYRLLNEIMPQAAEDFSTPLEQVSPDVTDDRTVIVEGLRLQYDEAHYWRVWGTCPRCSQACVSNSYRADSPYLGEMLVEFKPSYDHKCPVRETEWESLTDTEKALAARLYRQISQINVTEREE